MLGFFKLWIVGLFTFSIVWDHTLGSCKSCDDGLASANCRGTLNQVQMRGRQNVEVLGVPKLKQLQKEPTHNEHEHIECSTRASSMRLQSAGYKFFDMEIDA